MEATIIEELIHSGVISAWTAARGPLLALATGAVHFDEPEGDASENRERGCDVSEGR
jgi:hypothetical protein